ncbi:MAG: hypothetical protein LBU27_06215 [Candidatus Peribacteria bacterium]|nr:hypothetical protein [Candidatus Peribacteria bacterium]
MKRPDRNQFMYECLKMVRDGVSVFEIILKQDKQGIIIDKLAVRLPRTIYKRETSDGAFGITQNAPYQ